MKQNDIIHAMRRNGCHLQQLYAKLPEEFAVETIRDFRLCIKKLRAMLRLLNAGRGERSSLHFGKDMHAFYTAVGDVRSLQLQRAIVLKQCTELLCPPPENYLASLHDREEAAKQAARTMALHLQPKAILHSLQKKAQDRFDAKAAGYFIAGKKQELLALLAAGACCDSDLHTVRKILKDFLYLWPWIADVAGDYFPENTITRQSCEEMAEKLGDFQDHCLASVFFNPPYTDSVSMQDECSVLQALRSYNEVIRQEIKADLSERLSFLAHEIEKREALFVAVQTPELVNMPVVNF